MCGIVGHLGPQNSVEIVLEGLKRLEYRGYDSAGVSFIDEHDHLQVFKKSGPLDNLKALLGDKKYVARSCIGHTRWATHGEVSDTNSHPHNNDEISIVHNGIIENADDLKEVLVKEGYKFKSQTDSEVFLALVASATKAGENFLDAVRHSFSKVTGNSAFVVLNSKTSEIIALKRGAPLVCGINETSSEVFVSSDPYALVGLVDKLYFPEDGVICYLSAGHKNLLNFYELDATKSKRYMSKSQDKKLDIAEKGEYEHFMLKEIHEQPELIRALSQFYLNGEGKDTLLKMADLRPVKFHLAACGTAYYAGLVVKEYLERFNRISTNVELASEFRYRDPVLDKNDIAIFVSQSGETADTLAAQQLCKENNLKTLSIVNVEGSTLYRESQENLLIRAGIEIGVASTKAFTQMALTGWLLSQSLLNKTFNEALKVSISNKFSLLAERIDELLGRSEEIQKIAYEIYNYKGFFFTGRGIYHPIAYEGALKLKEIAYVHAEGYASGELKHGPIALIDENMVNIAVVGPELLEKTMSNIQEFKARKGIIVTLGPENHHHLQQLSNYYINLKFDGLNELAPLYVNVANQLLAYYMAKYKGTDIDKPRNLAKSVTVE